MLMEMLGTVIGFVTVILLLSLIVMALVQVVQYLFGLRSRNLRRGLELLLNLHLKEEITEFDSKQEIKNTNPKIEEPKQEEPKGARPIVDKILKPPIVAVPGTGNFLGMAVNKPLTWIESDQLVRSLSTSGLVISQGKMNALVTDFQDSQRILSQRFGYQIRWITFLLSIPVAVYFQVSTPRVLNDLSQDPQLQAQALAIAEGLNSEAEATLASLPSYTDISAKALEDLESKHEDLVPYIEQVGGIGSSREDILSELRDVLCDEVPDRCESLVMEYAALLDEYHSQAALEAVRLATEFTNSLAKLNLVPWQYGKEFYKEGKNVIGVLITIAFMSFGAPFWFARLAELLKLRDAIKPKSNSETA